MRLINTNTLKIHEFIDHRHAPEYAILSHCWGSDEVSFKDYTKEKIQHGTGYTKIISCCAFAKTRGRAWVWIDSCCIDKRSSAELSEAINSMFEWYCVAQECYAYLADVETVLLGTLEGSQQFRYSRWFKRDWTLQELIAPKDVVFLTQTWDPFGYISKPWISSRIRRIFAFERQETDGSVLTDTVANITNIPATVLRSYASSDYSAAQRISWMKGRSTTRLEDVAYCLLGIFGINMPLLYGEGYRAFERLLIEILNRTGDESVLIYNPGHTFNTLFPRVPTVFEYASNVERLLAHDRPSLTVSSQWTELHMTTQRPGVFVLRRDGTIRVIRLNCAATDREFLHPCVIFLSQVECGHFVGIGPSTYPGLVNSYSYPHGVLCESDLVDADAWYPEYDNTTMLIHLTLRDAFLCTSSVENVGAVCFTLNDRSVESGNDILTHSTQYRLSKEVDIERSDGTSASKNEYGDRDRKTYCPGA